MHWMRLWRRALPRGLFVAITLTATPAGACSAMTVTELANRLSGSARYNLGASELPAFLALWGELARPDLPATPDGVVLFARPGRPILVGFRKADCLLALLPSPPAALWRALRRHVGPIA